MIDSIKKEDTEIQWKDLDNSQYGFVKSLFKDKAKIKNIFKGELGKRGGFSGKNLPITVKILNRDDENPALETFTGFDNRVIVAYFGISPELENFVSIIMWPSTSKTSQKCYLKIFNILKEEHKALKFEGSYHLRPPNSIRPQNVSKLEIEDDKKLFYNWEYFPFIKDVGETLSKPISAINYRKVLLRDNNDDIFQDYVTMRVIVGSIKQMKGNEVRVKVPFIERNPHSFVFKIRHNVGYIEENDLLYFLLLERAGKRPPEVFAIEKINLGDVLSHMVSFELYKRFIKSSVGNEYRKYIYRILDHGLDYMLQTNENSNKDDLFNICSLEELKQIFNNYKYLIYEKVYPEFRGQTISFDLWDYVSKFNLSPYFRIDYKIGQVYYFPPIFNQDLKDNSCEKILKMNKLIHSYIYNE